MNTRHRQHRELTDAANTSVTVEKLRYNSSTGETEAYVLQPNEDLKVLNVTETKQVQTIQAETGNSAVFAVMWDSPKTVSGEDENSDTPIDSEGNDSDVDISDGEITPEPEVTEVPAEEPGSYRSTDGRADRNRGSGRGTGS